MYLSKACANIEGSEKLAYIIREKVIQGTAERIKRKVSGAVGVRYFYNLLKILDMEYASFCEGLLLYGGPCS